MKHALGHSLSFCLSHRVLFICGLFFLSVLSGSLNFLWKSRKQRYGSSLMLQRWIQRVFINGQRLHWISDDHYMKVHLHACLQKQKVLFFRRPYKTCKRNAPNRKQPQQADGQDHLSWQAQGSCTQIHHVSTHIAGLP